MSFIRYRYKSEKDFKLFPCDGMTCSVGYLKECLMGKSSKSASRRSKDEIEFIITNASTNEDYQDDSDSIPRNTSVIVVRRPRDSFEPLTPATAQHQLISFDNIIDGNLRPGLLSKTSTNTISCKNTPAKATNELKLIENVQKSVHQTIEPTSYVCHNCKRRGHIKRHCPLLVRSSTAKMHGTIDSEHKSSISVVPPASISAFRPHSHLINNKNTLLCSANDISIKESLSNKTQTSIDTHHHVPVSLSSSSNIFLDQSPLNFVIEPLSKDNDARLIQIRSVQPLSHASHIVSRSSPYYIPCGRVHRLPISETRLAISCDNLIATPREIAETL